MSATHWKTKFDERLTVPGIKPKPRSKIVE